MDLKLKIAVVLLLANLSACSLAPSTKANHAGFADLAFPAMLKTHTTMNLSLGPLLLKPAKWAIAQSEDNDIDGIEKELLSGVHAIQIRKYNTNKNQEYMLTHVEKSLSNIADKGWQTVVSINDESERVVIMTKAETNKIRGFVFIVVNPKESIFVNLMGDFNINSINAMAAKYQQLESEHTVVSI